MIIALGPSDVTVSIINIIIICFLSQQTPLSSLGG